MCTITNLTNFESYKPFKPIHDGAPSNQLDGFLLQLLVDSPEVNKIESMVDNYFWTIHGSNNSVSTLIELFLQFIQTNSDILETSSKTKQEKANELFNAYRQAFFMTFRKEGIFCDLFEKQKSAILSYFPASKIESGIEHIVLTKIKSFHSSVPGSAIEKVLDLPSYSLILHTYPDDFSTTQMNVSDLLTFFQARFTKF